MTIFYYITQSLTTFKLPITIYNSSFNTRCRHCVLTSLYTGITVTADTYSEHYLVSNIYVIGLEKKKFNN